MDSSLLNFSPRRPLLARRSSIVGALFGVAGGVISCGDRFTNCQETRTCESTTGGRSNGGQGGGGLAGSSVLGGANPSTGGSNGDTVNVAGAGQSDGGGGAAGAGSGEGASGGSASGEAGSGGAPPPECDASKGPLDDACTVTEDFGVFVSPLGNDSKGDGSREHPFASLATALLHASAQSKRLYACATEGAFEETVLVDESLDRSALYGGFDCDDWSISEASRTEVKSRDSVALKVQGVTAVEIEGFHFTSSDATKAGESSAGAWIVNSTGVMLRRSALHAATGAPGETGTSVTMAAGYGAPGSAGTAACTVLAAPNLGGTATQTVCGGEPSGSVGGKGGTAGSNADSAWQGGTGLPFATGTLGLPGTGQTTSTWTCAVGPGLGIGRAGADGLIGTTGSGGKGAGVLTAEGFQAPAGMPGEAGGPGQGGGGGGGAMAPSACASLAPRTGASGGSGGGGGCGGKAGGAGSGGGGSFGLVSFKSTIRLESVELVARSGGDGGPGGAGQPGGGGGLPGSGAAGAATSMASCSGGPGGAGGRGGPGGGGAGGPSIGIAFVGSAPTQLGATSIEVSSTPAAGGSDGSGAAASPGSGEPGITAKALAYY